MIRYALFPYVPKRHLSRASFEEMALHYMILGFKDGYNVYTRWAVRQFALAMAEMDLHGVAIACIPASTRYSHVRRWKRFADSLCRMTGAVNGFPHVHVSGSRSRVHITGDRSDSQNIKHYVDIEHGFFRGRTVIVIDDICTTGQTSLAFVEALRNAGATVPMVICLAKTKPYGSIGVPY
jgi:predicted amidophosphoribosyltransferase